MWKRILEIMSLIVILSVTPGYGQDTETFRCGEDDSGGGHRSSPITSGEFSGAAVAIFAWIPGNWVAYGDAFMDSTYDPQTDVELELPTWAEFFVDIDATDRSITALFKDESSIPDTSDSKLKLDGETPQYTGPGSCFFA
ncbi:MAG: hypothetical protein B6244_01480 [Candidatus Cloacimonetes bacterium 4572_55]|nr:MAG: hypothetical protein B6244_01480 [Candidatus Cloacimonetes bacterium 4572_55]